MEVGSEAVGLQCPGKANQLGEGHRRSTWRGRPLCAPSTINRVLCIVCCVLSVAQATSCVVYGTHRELQRLATLVGGVEDGAASQAALVVAPAA